jgi:hypothetical protein
MTRFMLFAGMALVLGASGPIVRSEQPTPEQIIDKALRAHGGEDRLKELSGFCLKDRTIYDKGQTWNFEMTVSPPQRYRSEVKVGSEGKPRVMVIDGDQGWIKTSDEVISYPPTFLDSMRKYTIPYTGPRSILRLRDRQKNPRCHFSTVGECTIDGHPAVGVLMKLEGGSQQTWYFDKDSGLLLKQENRTANFEGEDTVTVSTFSDYQTFEGIPIARKENNERDGKPSSTTELIDFRVVTPSEGAFAKP